MARYPLFRSRLDKARQAQEDQRRRALLDDLDVVFKRQYDRLSIQFKRDDLRRLEDRWSDGAWIGRSGLELKEHRR